LEIVLSKDALNGIENYDALIAWSKERTEVYAGLVVEETAIAGAKQDTADLRRVAKFASDERIRITREHEQKIKKTIDQLKEVTNIFNTAADNISSQVKAFEQKDKNAKQEAITAFFVKTVTPEIANYLTIGKLWNDKWLNKGYSIQDIEKEITEKITKATQDYRIITVMGLSPEITAAMLESYFNRLDMGDALEKKRTLEEQAERLRVAKMQAEAKKEEPQSRADEQQNAPLPFEQPAIEEQVFTVDIRLFVTEKQKHMFRTFLIENGIKYTSVPKN
jgi:hypothetical protein